MGCPPPDQIGRASRMDDAVGRMVEYAKGSFPRKQALGGMKVVLDCANGAAYKVAPKVLWELEAEVVLMGVSPNGKNINLDCGATHTESLQAKVAEVGADIGIALDGDADRLILVDERGQRIDGDQILALLGTHMKHHGLLKHNTVVATVMSNLGLERYFRTKGISLLRTAVGDRYVVEKMREGNFNLGGEQSGHVVMSDFGTTGDGLLAALQVLSILRENGQKASEALNLFTPVPQVLKNVRFTKGSKPLEQDDVKTALRIAEETLANSGRLLVRASGTEPLIRVMAEGDNPDMVQSVVDDVCNVITRVAG